MNIKKEESSNKVIEIHLKYLSSSYTKKYVMCAKKDEWYHKQEWKYTPFIAKWKGEEGYKTIAECGVISNEKEFSIDHECVAKINKEH